MPGTKEGGAKCATTIKAKYGADYYTAIGTKGGKAKVPKGFAVNRELARLAGAKGGKISKRKRASEYL